MTSQEVGGTSGKLEVLTLRADEAFLERVAPQEVFMQRLPSDNINIAQATRTCMG